jgi:hypothetical protein
MTDNVTNSLFFTNRDGNTLMKQFENFLKKNPQVKNLDAVVGFLRASGYFALRPFLDNINKVRVLIGIDVDKYIARAAQHRELFMGAEEEVKEDALQQIKCNMRGWDPASEDDTHDNGMSRWSENNDEEGWN